MLALWSLVVLDDLGQAVYTIFACFPPGKAEVGIVARAKWNDGCERADHGTVHREGTTSTFVHCSNKGTHKKNFNSLSF